MNPRALALLMMLTLGAVDSGAATLRVPKDFDTVQDAITAAGLDDTVLISKGVYFENLTIDAKTLVTVKAKKGALVIIDAGGLGVPLTITNSSSSITVRDIEVRNSNAEGIVVDGGSDVTIRSCKVTNSAQFGISISTTANANVSKCKVSGTGGDGIRLDATVNTLVDRCVVVNAGTDGITVLATGATIRDNTVRDPGASGVVLSDGTGPAVNVLVEGNRIEAAGLDGVRVDDTASFASIFGNDFIDSTRHGAFVESGATNILLVDNHARSPNNDGFSLSAPGVQLWKNVAKKAGFDGFRINGDDGHFQANKAKKSGADAFSTVGIDNTLIENVAKKSGVVDFDGDSVTNFLLNNAFTTFDP